MESTVGAHGHGGAEDIGGLGATGGQSQDVLNLERTLALAQPHGLFDGELVEWVQGMLDAGGLDAGLRLVDAGLDLWESPKFHVSFPL